MSPFIVFDVGGNNYRVVTVAHFNSQKLYIRSKTEYRRVVAFMNSLLDVVGDDETHELAGLLVLVGQLVADYDEANHPIADAPAHEVLRFLVERHRLTQSDLAVEIGGQSVVSEILNGKRAINARQAKALAVRFGVSVRCVLMGGSGRRRG